MISSTLGVSFKRVVRTWSFSQKPQRAGRVHGTPIGLLRILSVLGNLQKIVFSYQSDLRTFPFAYPEFTEEDELGQQTVSYPSKHTEIFFPHLDQQPRIREEQPNLDDVVAPPPPGKKRKVEQHQATQDKRDRIKTRKI